MAQETLKITITADNKQAVQNIQETVVATTQMGAAFRNVTPASNQATQALVNVSRVAQDAPYGFLGIANNLNPLLESFQRLKETTGTAGSALKEMAKGLMGPAGIGLALGVVSSLIVAFGPKIAKFINGTTAASEAQDKLKESLDKARASASENGIKLLTYIRVAEDATNTDARRKEALDAVRSELGKVNASYTATIKTTDDARKAVTLYTDALVAQAITSRYIDEIADKNIKLADATKLATKAGQDYAASVERSKNMVNGYVDASVTMASITNRDKDAFDAAKKSVTNLTNEITDLNDEVFTITNNAIKSNNAYYVMDKGAKDLDKTIVNLTKNYKAFNKLTAEQVGTFLPQQQGVSPVAPAAPQGILGRGPSQALVEADAINQAASEQAKFNFLLNEAATTASYIAQGVGSIFQAIAQGENIGEAVTNMFRNMVLELAQMVVQALIFKAIMTALGMGGVPVPSSGGDIFGGLGKLLGFTKMADGGIVSKPTFAMVGEGGESEAIMPLSKLDSFFGKAFSAGANSGDTMSGGSFVLRGNDLVLAMQRSNYSLNLRRGV